MSKRTNPITEISVSCGFYNSLNGDRTYDTLQMSSLFDGIIRDGIFASIGDCFAVHADSGNTVKVGTGKAWFNHTWTLNDAPLLVDCEEAEPNMDRIDAVILEVNTTEAKRDNFIMVIEGTPSAKAKDKDDLRDCTGCPKLQNDAGVYQYPLCYIYRPAGSTEILEDYIRPMIGTEGITPFVSGILEVISFDAVLGKWTAELETFKENEKDNIAAFMNEQEGDFNEWFDQMKGIMQTIIAETTDWSNDQKAYIEAWFVKMQNQLSNDAAINLQLQIDNEEAKRLLMVGFVDGEKTFSEDGTTIISTDPYGRRIVKTFTNNFLTCTTELFSAEGGMIARTVKNFSEDGSTISTETTIEDLSLVNGDNIAY